MVLAGARQLTRKSLSECENTGYLNGIRKIEVAHFRFASPGSKARKYMCFCFCVDGKRYGQDLSLHCWPWNWHAINEQWKYVLLLFKRPILVHWNLNDTNARPEKNGWIMACGSQLYLKWDFSGTVGPSPLPFSLSPPQTPCPAPELTLRERNRARWYRVSEAVVIQVPSRRTGATDLSLFEVLTQRSTMWSRVTAWAKFWEVVGWGASTWLHQ